MERPREIEYEFHSEGSETYIYWEQYAKSLEMYATHLEQQNTDLENNLKLARKAIEVFELSNRKDK